MTTPKQQDVETVAALLTADGWHEDVNQFKQYSRCFYKRFDTPTRCHYNNKRPGIQVEIAVMNRLGGGVVMEIELHGGLQDNTWLHLKNYSLPETIEEVIPLIPRMLSAWEAANQKTT